MPRVTPPRHPDLHGWARSGLYRCEDESGDRTEGGEAVMPSASLLPRRYRIRAAMNKFVICSPAYEPDTALLSYAPLSSKDSIRNICGRLENWM
jgi:hypothetical protein